MDAIEETRATVPDGRGIPASAPSAPHAVAASDALWGHGGPSERSGEVQAEQGANGSVQGAEPTPAEPVAEKMAVLAHERLHWQAEAERWRLVAHAQRERIAALESGPDRHLVRDLVGALEETRPFVLHADQRWAHGRIGSAIALLDQAVQRARAWLLT